MVARATSQLLDADAKEAPLPLGQRMPLPMLLISYCLVSTGMMVMNKVSLALLPPVSLVGLQALFAVFAMLFMNAELGSPADQRRFMVVPAFFCGMLCFSALTMHKNSMTFLIVFRSCTPIVSLAMERAVFTKVRTITPLMVIALLGAVLGAAMFVWADFDSDNITVKVLAFCVANMIMASGDRVANRWVVAERPVKMNNEGMVLINNAFTAVFCFLLAYHTGEHRTVTAAMADVTPRQGLIIFGSCVAGAMLGIAAFATQRRITATDMQVLINANKVGVIVIEVLFMGKVLAGFSLAGCILALCSGAVYSHAVMQSPVQDQGDQEEKKRLLEKERRNP